MPRKKRYTPSAQEIGQPQYDKPRQLQPYNLVGAAGPPIGADPIAQLASGLQQFNRAGLAVAGAKQSRDAQNALEHVPVLEEGILEDKLALKRQMNKIGIPMLGGEWVYDAALTKTGANQAPRDLDLVFANPEVKSWLHQQKDTTDFPTRALDYILQKSTDWQEEEGDSSERITSLFKKGYEATYKAGAIQKLGPYNKAWSEREDNKIRLTNIRSARDKLHDAIEDHLDGDDMNKALATFKDDAYLKMYVDWPENLAKGLTYNKDLWSQVVQPVFTDALGNDDIDIDQLVTLYEKVGKLRRPTKTNGEVTGSTEFFGKFREEADAWYEKAYEAAKDQAQKVNQRDSVEAEHWGSNILHPLLEGVDALLQGDTSEANNPFEPETLKKLQDLNINTIHDVNMDNLDEFFNALSDDNNMFELLNTKAGDRQDWLFMNKQLEKVKSVISKLAIDGDKFKDDHLALADKHAAQLVWGSPYLRHVEPFFRKEFFPKVLKEGWTQEQAVAAFLQEYDVEDMFLATNPNHTIETNKLKGILSDLFEERFFGGDENESKRYIENYLKTVSRSLSHGVVPEGALEELRSMRLTEVGKSQTVDGDIGRVIDRIKEIKKDLGFYQNKNLESIAVINEVARENGSTIAGGEGSLFTEVLFWYNLSERESSNDQTGIGVDYDTQENLRENAPKIAKAERVMQAWKSDVELYKTDAVKNWIQQQRDAGFTEPVDLNRRFNEGGWKEIRDNIKNHFSSPSQVQIYEDMYRQSTGATDFNEVEDVLNPAPDPNAADSDVTPTEDAPMNAAYRQQMDGVADVIQGHSQETLTNLTPTGSGRNLALEAFVGPLGDRMSENAIRIRKQHQKNVVAKAGAIINETKKLRGLEADPLKNSVAIQTSQAQIANDLKYYRAIRLKYEGIPWEDVVDGTANFDIDAQGELIKIPVEGQHLDLNTVLPVQHWSELDEFVAIYDELEQYATAGGVDEKGESVGMVDALNSLDQVKVDKLLKWNNFLGKVENINILNPNEEARQEDVAKYGRLAAKWRQKIIAFQPEKLPPAVNTQLKLTQLDNMFGSKEWPKGGDLKAPTGQNYMFAGVEYTPPQAEHIRAAFQAHDYMAKNGLSTQNGITLRDYYELRNGIAGGTVPGWKKSVSPSMPTGAGGGFGIGNTGGVTTVYPGKVRFKPSDFTDEELMNDGQLKSSAALELTMAEMGYENPLAAAGALNPLDDLTHKHSGDRSKAEWEEMRGYRGGIRVPFHDRGIDPDDPRHVWINSSRPRKDGDMYFPTGKHSSFAFLQQWYFNVPLLGGSREKYRNKNFDDIYHKYYRLLSGGGDVEMKQGMMPTSSSYKKQLSGGDPRVSSSVLADAYNMLIRRTNQEVDSFGEPTGNHFAPYLKAFNMAPIPLPKKSWEPAVPPSDTPSNFEAMKAAEAEVTPDAWGNFVEEQKANMLDAGHSVKEGDQTTMKLDLEELRKKMGVPEGSKLYFRSVKKAKDKK